MDLYHSTTSQPLHIEIFEFRPSYSSNTKKQLRICARTGRHSLFLSQQNIFISITPTQRKRTTVITNTLHRAKEEQRKHEEVLRQCRPDESAR
jgi:hypothetical protein